MPSQDAPAMPGPSEKSPYDHLHELKERTAAWQEAGYEIGEIRERIADTMYGMTLAGRIGRSLPIGLLLAAVVIGTTTVSMATGYSVEPDTLVHITLAAIAALLGVLVVRMLWVSRGPAWVRVLSSCACGGALVGLYNCMFGNPWLGLQILLWSLAAVAILLLTRIRRPLFLSTILPTVLVAAIATTPLASLAIVGWFPSPTSTALYVLAAGLVAVGIWRAFPAGRWIAPAASLVAAIPVLLLVSQDIVWSNAISISIVFYAAALAGVVLARQLGCLRLRILLLAAAIAVGVTAGFVMDGISRSAWRYLSFYALSPGNHVGLGMGLMVLPAALSFLLRGRTAPSPMPAVETVLAIVPLPFLAISYARLQDLRSVHHPYFVASFLIFGVALIGLLALLPAQRAGGIRWLMVRARQREDEDEAVSNERPDAPAIHDEPASVEPDAEIETADNPSDADATSTDAGDDPQDST